MIQRDIRGTILNHRIYGTETMTAQKDNRITLRFGDNREQMLSLAASASACTIAAEDVQTQESWGSSASRMKFAGSLTLSGGGSRTVFCNAVWMK